MSDSLAFQVELFADLMVRLDDPFGDRGVVLAAAGLDEEQYRSLVTGWRTRFDRDEGRLGERFADAYGERRASLAARREREASGAAAPADARFLNAEALGFREEAARVARETADAPPPLHAPEHEVAAAAPGPGSVPPPAPPLVARPPERFAGTADISAFVPRVAVPFAAANPAAPPVAAAPTAAPRPRVDSGTRAMAAFASPPTPTPFVDREAAAPTPPPLVARPPERFAGTADISAFVPRAATPFQGAAPAEPPRAAQPAEPRRRLIRFDPQTGQPLPAPIWVDLPPEGEGQKR
jgi:hypothetical protein